MMKWVFVTLLLLLLSACSNPVSKTYYLLPNLNIPVASSSGVSINSHQLWLNNIDVSDFLSQGGVVYQTNEVKYVIAQNNLWASPLAQQLKQTLMSTLNTAMPGWTVSSQPMGEDQDILNITVNGFHGRYDGSVIISGEWQLNHQGQLSDRSFHLVIPQQKDGYDALIQTLAAGWHQEALKIATEIIKLDNKRPQHTVN